MKQNIEKALINCNCGCGDSLLLQHIQYEGGTGDLIISAMGELFYKKQGVGSVLKDRLALLFGKRCIFEMMLRYDEVFELYEFLCCNPIDTEYAENMSHITFHKERDGMVSLSIISDLKKSDIIRGNEFFAYSITLTESEREKLVQKLRRIMDYIRKEELNDEKE